MSTLPYQNQPELFPHLIAWFRYRNVKPKSFYRLGQLLKETNSTPKNIVASEVDYSPLTRPEEDRWRILERKAKQENLSGRDSAEFDILLEIQLYNRYKKQYPHLSHRALVMLVKKATA